MKKALVLLSGGLDSTTALYVPQEQGFDELYAITFEYGQKHDKEIKAAKAVAKAAGVKEHKFVKIMLNQWDGCSYRHLYWGQRGRLFRIRGLPGRIHPFHGTNHKLGNRSRCREKTEDHPSRPLHAHDQGRRGTFGESFRS